MSKDVIAVVVFAADEERVHIVERLESLGFCAVTMSQEQWLVPAEPLHVVEVLLLGDNAPLASIVRMAPQRFMPRLVLLGAGRLHEGGAVSALGDELAVWPCSEAELVLRLDRLLQSALNRSKIHLRRSKTESFSDLNLVGAAPVFKRMLDMVVKVSRFDVPVVIEGAAGSGKEVVARAVHRVGARRERAFVVLNCAALHEKSLEGELFGRQKGAATDANEEHIGLVELAERGTLFLDEIDTLTEKAQATLLRFLLEKEYRPHGGRVSKKSDVRVIAASNVSLDGLVMTGRFRRDLYFRLSVVNIVVPPLRTREGDVLVLAEHFMCKYRLEYQQPKKFLTADTLNWMVRHAWPGNVRELENAIHRAFVLAGTDAVEFSLGENSAPERRGNLSDRRQALDTLLKKQGLGHDVALA